MLIFIFFLSLITVFLFIYPFLQYSASKKKTIIRINRYANLEDMKDEKKRAARRDYRIGFEIIARRIAGVRFLDGYKRKIQKQLISGHIFLKSEEYITVCLILFIIGGLLGYITTMNVIIAFFIALACWFIPSIFLKAKTRSRIKTLNEQLGDAIVLISNSLKAGYSFFQAVDAVSKEMSGPISEEFTQMQKEINLGTTTEQALENLANRVESDDLDMVVTAVLIQRQVGGNLSEILDNISTTIRDRVKIKGDIKAITAQGRMSGIIISVLPVGLGIVLYIINPEHISLLFKEQLGIAILVFSGIMELTGIFLINKIVKIEI